MATMNGLELVTQILQPVRIPKLNKDLKVKKRKELCLFPKRDFESMFTKAESNGLMEYLRIKSLWSRAVITIGEELTSYTISRRTLANGL